MNLSLNKKIIIFAMILLSLQFLFIRHQFKRNMMLYSAVMTIHKNDILRKVIELSKHLHSNQLRLIAKMLHDGKLTNDHYRFFISVTQKPKWREKYYYHNHRQNIEYYTYHIQRSRRLSYQLKDKYWLNFSQTPLFKASIDFIFFVIIVEIVFIGLVLFYGLSLERFRGPLEKIKKSAIKLGIDMNADTIHSHIKSHAPKLVKETIIAMQRMQLRIQDLVETRTKMLAAISHDLRTPITRLKLRAQLLRDPEAAEKINQNLLEMSNMIDSILAFSRKDSIGEKMNRFDLLALVETIVEEFIDMKQPVSFKTELVKLTFFGKQLALKRAITNLINNALKYGQDAIVSLARHKKNISLIVEDHGPGIPEKELELVFKPYYRAKNTRSKSSAGTGLGLAITKEICIMHGGSLTIQNKPNNSGLIATIALPYHHL